MNLNRFRQGGEAPLLPITALIDVVFLIIIFLVLGANFDQVDTVRLPEARGRSSDGQGPLQIELRADGSLWLERRHIPESEVLEALARRSPRAVLILPDEKASVGALIAWYDRIGRHLRVPVQVGVRAPAADGEQSP